MLYTGFEAGSPSPTKRRATPEADQDSIRKPQRVQSKVIWRDVGKACRWEHPSALSIRLLFLDEWTTPAALTFFRETKVGRMVKQTSPE